MTERETKEQEELWEIVKGLRIFCLALEGLHQKIPISPEEDAMLLHEKEADISTEMRRVIECGLQDSLRPLIRDLEAVASYRPKGEQGE
jgi:hypothetical protein